MKPHGKKWAEMVRVGGNATAARKMSGVCAGDFIIMT